MFLHHRLPWLLLVLLVITSSGGALAAGNGPGAPAFLAGPGFTYQGELHNGSGLVNDICKFKFSLYDLGAFGNQIGATEAISSVSVVAGRFTVLVNAGGQFGVSAFDGSARWLEIAVMCSTDVGYLTLSPRQPLTAAPLALALPGLRTQPNATSPNVIGGSTSNTVGAAVGATIGGGGDTVGHNNAAVADYATVGGGIANTAEGIAATVGGGGWDGTLIGGNTAGGIASTVGGGWSNTIPASAKFAAVGGGGLNTASGFWATIAGGDHNTASGQQASVGGGLQNVASNQAASVGGGLQNVASNQAASVGGGQHNTASGSAATVAGGDSNTASGSLATVGGGQINFASNTGAAVGGGVSNNASGDSALVAGGDANSASGGEATVGGGQLNSATGPGATVGGGQQNTAGGTDAVVAGGFGHLASGFYAAVGGGYSNTASSQYTTVAGGLGNVASGVAAMVAGGDANVASGNDSFAAGYQARALHNGVFVWSDTSGSPISATVTDEFLVRASGGITLYTDALATVGAVLPAGSGSWASISDRNMKANFDTVDGLQVLNALAGIPIQTWNYKAQDAAIRHIGPMAQDFHAAFGVGENDTTISTVDGQGVALAAIQGLYKLVQQKDAQIAAQQADITALKAGQEQTDARLAALETKTSPAAQPAPSAQAPGTNTLQLLLVLMVGVALGGGLCLGAFALGRAKRAEALSGTGDRL